MRLTCIIPARNAESTIARCIGAVLRSERRPDEVVVVDDASTDRTAESASAFPGIRLLRVQGPLPAGPSRARNLAAAESGGEFLVFVDADVVLHPEAIGRLAAAVEADERCGAAFGSYCDNPPGRRLAGRYKNLLHHHSHQRAPREASTFWAGCGCVRREAFDAAGGFDHRYTAPSIEDIELGVRLRAAGWRICVIPDALGTHLKDWTVGQVWRTDVLCRALPWSRLLRQRGRIPAQLNLNIGERIAACSAAGAVAGAALGAAWHPSAWIAALMAILVCGLINAPFLTLLARRGGLPLLVVGSAMHFAYYLYSLAVFAAVWALHRPRPSHAPADPGSSKPAATTAAR